MLILKAHILVQTPALYGRYKHGSSSWDRFRQTRLSSPKGTKEPFLASAATYSCHNGGIEHGDRT